VKTRLGLIALKLRAFFSNKNKPTELELATKESEVKMIPDDTGWQWWIPQQLIDEGVNPGRPVSEVLAACCRCGFEMRLDWRNERVIFKFVPPPLMLVGDDIHKTVDTVGALLAVVPKDAP